MGRSNVFKWLACCMLAGGCGDSDETMNETAVQTEDAGGPTAPSTEPEDVGGESKSSVNVRMPEATEGRRPADVVEATPGDAGSMAEVPEQACEALAVIHDACAGCHASEPMFGAPMSLVTLADLRVPAVTEPEQLVAEKMLVRLQDEKQPMPPPPGELPEADLQLILDAFADGVPEGECELPKPPVTEMAEDTFVWPPDCEEHYKFISHAMEDPEAPHEVLPGTETHPQFVYDAPWGDDEVHILARRPITDNSKVIHHWILWANGETEQTSKSLSGWAPGQQEDPTWLPDDVGMETPTGTDALRLDLHYYNLNGDKVEYDQSGVEICITRTLRPHTANIMGLFASADIAPNERAVNTLPCTVDVDPGAEAYLLAVTPHMHKLGVHAKLELLQGEQTSVLHDEPFDFMEQRTYPLGSVPLNSGDVLRTTCSFENTTNKMITFGEGSDDEMCINWVITYPAGAMRCQIQR